MQCHWDNPVSRRPYESTNTCKKRSFFGGLCVYINMRYLVMHHITQNIELNREKIR